jgi:FAD/FMN-containing dehydrogenase
LCGVRETVSADRGIGTQKRELMKECSQQKTKGTTVSYILMVQIEKVFDPYNIFNPGKMV